MIDSRSPPRTLTEARRQYCWSDMLSQSHQASVEKLPARSTARSPQPPIISRPPNHCHRAPRVSTVIRAAFPSVRTLPGVFANPQCTRFKRSTCKLLSQYPVQSEAPAHSAGECSRYPLGALPRSVESRPLTGGSNSVQDKRRSGRRRCCRYRDNWRILAHAAGHRVRNEKAITLPANQGRLG